MRVIPKQVAAGRNDSLPRLLQGLHEESRRQLLRGAENCRFAAGESLEEDDGAAVGLVLTGVVRTYVLGPGGRQQTLRYLQPGDLVGAERLFGETCDICAEAVTPVRWMRLLPSHIVNLMRMDASVSAAIARELAADHAAAIEQVCQTAFFGLRERLAHHLLARSAVGQPSLPLTQKQMAAMVGSVREVVGRLAKELERAGAVRRLKGGGIEVDADALRPFLPNWPRDALVEMPIAQVS